MGKIITIEQLHAIAAKRGGKCLAKKHEHLVRKTRWECSEGHRWETFTRNVWYGRWCPECAREKRRGRKNARLTLEDMKREAENRGGKCTSRKYVNLLTPMRWKCAKGHRWKMRANDIRSGGQWCPVCARQQKRRLRLERRKGGTSGK